MLFDFLSHRDINANMFFYFSSYVPSFCQKSLLRLKKIEKKEFDRILLISMMIKLIG